MSVAVITGAARGIGAATALRMAKDGWELILVDSCTDNAALGYPLATRDDLDATVAKCGNAVGVAADVRDSLDDVITQPIDAAIAVAGGIAGGSPAWTTSDAEWDAMLGINLIGVRNLARAAIPRMRRPGGRFVAVSSAGGTLGLPRLSAYSAAKHAVVGFIRSLAAELGPEGITANAVAPGSTATQMLDASAAVYGLTDTQEFAAHHQLPRLIEPAEVAEVIAWLCSPASSAITGAVIPVDAGMTAS